MRVQICTPSLDGVPSIEYQTSLMRTNNLLLQYGHFVDLNFIRGDQFISKARNGLVQGFLESPEKPEVLFFVDDDEGWDEQGFLRMCLDPHGIVCAAVPKKTDTGEFNNVVLDIQADNKCIVESGMIRAKQIGSGFMSIKRWAIEKLIAAYPQKYRPGDGGPHEFHYSLFDASIHWGKEGEVGQFWGEDLDFCRKWCALGEYIWIDPNLNMQHAGRKVYSGNFLDYLRATCEVELNKPQLKAA